MNARPCPVCGLVITRHPCSRCGHVAGDILEETSTIINAAQLVDETERFLAFGGYTERMQEVLDEISDNGGEASPPLLVKGMKVLYDYMRDGGRAEPLEEEPE